MTSHAPAATRRTFAAVLAVAAAVLVPTLAVSEQQEDGGGIVFRSAVDDEPLDVSTFIDKPDTPALAAFIRTGRNPYVGNAEAKLAGKDRYEQWCQQCHLADASGRMGPSLVDEVYNYKRSATDVGMFEIIYGGAAGAMQPFNERLTPDEILRVMAYVRSLKR